ncbi:MAG TPA: hypothetical protein VFU21_14495 [Kofleriaceae bacterium]|nr:hypothetical protein [Kofleriaceae bacterium]
MNARRLIAAALVALGGCVDTLEPGEHGVMRYFGEVRGAPPLALLPPIADRDGNVYVLYGARELSTALAFVGHAGGGWTGGCSLHKGDSRGAHFWVGRAQDRAWYWSGDALVEVDGGTGSCKLVLDKDPASNTDLLFMGVVPFVKEAPSRTTLVALFTSPADPVPYHGVIDLDLGRYSELDRFEPRDAENVVVLGTGSDEDGEVGVMLVGYTLGGELVLEGRFLDDAGRTTAVAPISGGDELLGQDAVLGQLQVSPDGTVAGLLADGRMVLFDDNGGSVGSFALDMTPVGVHRDPGGSLWLVGESGGPVVARLGSDGRPGAPVAWTASERAAAAVSGDVRVLDDRTDPRRYTTWPDPVSAMGAWPFLTAAPPLVYAEDATAWLFAGPSYSVSGEPRTSVALAPVGITYP